MNFAPYIPSQIEDISGLTGALAGKEPTLTPGTTTQFYRGDKTWQTLNYLAVAGLSTVAHSGAYADLSGVPSLASVALSGAYADLSGRPTLATVATTGAYSDLTGKPTLFTQAAADALYKPIAYQPAAADISDATAAGRALLTGADAAAQKSLLSLQNVDNTSDATKFANAQAAASTWAPQFKLVQSVNGPGTVSNTAGGTAVTGVGTTFLSTFKSGDSITIGANTVTIASIASDTAMTTGAIAAAHTNSAYTLTGRTVLVANGNGNIGVGTATSPTNVFSVGGNISVDGIVNLEGNNTGGNWGIGLNPSGRAQSRSLVTGSYVGIFSHSSGGTSIGSAGGNSVAEFDNTTGNTYLRKGLGIGAVTTKLLQVVQGTAGVGTVSNTAGSGAVTGVGTTFTTTFKVGDTITIGGQTVAISAIASDTAMTTAAITAANTGVAYTLTGGTRFRVDGNGYIYLDQDARINIGSGNYITTNGGSRDGLTIHSGSNVAIEGTLQIAGITTTGANSNVFYLRSGYTFAVPCQLYGFAGQSEPLAKWYQKDSVGNDRYVGAIDFTMPVTVAATRTGRAALRVSDYAAEREIMRGEANGTAAAIGFLGATAVTRPTITGSKSSGAALTSLLSALASLGLITDSTTA